jgi:hypothetical protein
MVMEKTSHSKCEVFNNCALQGYFKYVIYAEPEPKFKDNAYAGSYVHDCIEKWFKHYDEGGYDFAGFAFPGEHFANTMEEIYRANSDNIPCEADDDVITLCINNFVDFMSKRLDYVKRINMIDCFLPIIMETEFKKTINGVPLHGYLDAGFKDKKIWLCDWKSSKKPDITVGYIKQGTRYVMLVEDSPLIDGMPIDDFFVVNLRQDVDLSKFRFPVTSEMKRIQEKELADVWAIMNGTHFPKPEKKDCFFCEYKMRCAAYPPEGVIHDPTKPIEKSPRGSYGRHSAPAIDNGFMDDIFSDLGIGEVPEIIEATIIEETIEDNLTYIEPNIITEEFKAEKIDAGIPVKEKFKEQSIEDWF